ncbi:DUF4185 domain-containing protein [Streptomyces sp. NPDC049954]|uniref:DUF4185 domain-containing protein n=1 Tax=Streptomyces sp. NPDC049954 TaxID=3155779 RepID=UPI0034259533
MTSMHRRRFLGLAAGAAAVPAAASLWPRSAQAAEAEGDTAPRAAAGVFVYPAPGQSTGPGTLPPKAAGTEYLGPQNYGRDLALDLGFSGVVSGRSVWTYGDTLVPDGTGGWALTASDSVALGDKDDPLRVHHRLDDSGNPDEWIPLNDAENDAGGLSRYGMGGTNVVEYAPGRGLVWYLKNDRGSDGQGLVGAGVATVTADDSGALAVRTSDTTWGPSEPHWGDVGVTLDPRDGKVYVYGYGPESFGHHVYLARAAADRATDVSAYEYWDQSQKSWTSRRFTLSGDLGTVKLSADLALFSHDELGQSNAFWSNHYNTWMFVAGANVGYTDIMVMTAPALEGPWTEPFTVASTCPGDTCGGVRYCIAPHPEYDESGETLLVTWTDDNVIHSSRIHWE